MPPPQAGRRSLRWVLPADLDDTRRRLAVLDREAARIAYNLADPAIVAAQGKGYWAWAQGSTGPPRSQPQ
jgi:hypothetical protein